MAQLIVAVKSCQRDKDAGFHDAIRETWGRDLKAKGVQVMFFIGLPPGVASMGHPQGYNQVLQRDEFIVNAADDYNSLPFKTRGICQWATAKVFTHLFLCDCDTIINRRRMARMLRHRIYLCCLDVYRAVRTSPTINFAPRVRRTDNSEVGA